MRSLLSYPFFVRAFHGDPTVAERAITINGRQVTIAGVLPPGFRPQLTRPPAFSGLTEKEAEAYRPLVVTATHRRAGPSSSVSLES